MKKLCIDCKKDISKTFKTRKRCFDCAELRLKKPIGRITKEQERIVRKYAGTMFIKDLAKKAKVSDSTLDRWARDNDVNINHLKYRPEIIDAVTKFYEKHGKVKTQKKFPNVKIRSIVEKYKTFIPRQSRWTDEQKMDLVKFAGLVSHKQQAIYFNRPFANEGSIISAWSKTLKDIPTRHCIHGMYSHKARLFVKRTCPYIATNSLTKKTKVIQKIHLWSDMEKHFRKDCPQFISNAISAMALFQKKLYKTNNPRKEILKMIKERELDLEKVGER